MKPWHILLLTMFSVCFRAATKLPRFGRGLVPAAECNGSIATYAAGNQSMV